MLKKGNVETEVELSTALSFVRPNVNAERMYSGASDRDE